CRGSLERSRFPDLVRGCPFGDAPGAEVRGAGLSAEVAIVGAGILGASIAWHLAALGVRDVVLFDRGAPGQGSTARATGGFRAQFGTPFEVRLALDRKSTRLNSSH